MEFNEVSKTEAKNLRMVAQTARDNSEEAQWKLAVALHTIYYSGYKIGENEYKDIFELWGYDEWYDYVEAEVGIHVGRASMMVQTVHFFKVRMGDAWKGRYTSMTKMRSIATAPNTSPKNVNELIRKSKTMKPCDLDHELGHGHGHHRKSATFKLSENDHTALKEALDSLMATGEYTDRGEALMSVFKKGRRALKAA